MPKMTIRCTNSTFESAAAAEFATVENAYQTGIVSALKIAAEEVASGAPSSIVQFAVELAEHERAALGAVAISTARLLNSEPAVISAER